jgi:flagellin
MGFRINTNMPALEAQRPLRKVSRETDEAFAKLSSGERINKAADDAAGLAISEKLKAEIRSSRQANRNANDGISLVQTAEGGLNESSSLLTRMRELAIQAASDTLSDSDRDKSSMEYEQLKTELDRISQTTEFNGKKLLNGTSPKMDFQVGVGNHSTDDIISYQSQNLDSGIVALGVSEASIRSKQSAQNSLSRIGQALDKITSNRSQIGSIQNRLMNSSNNLQVYSENMSAANSRIRDTDYALEAANAARNSIITSTSSAVAAQANMSGQGALKLLS